MMQDLSQYKTCYRTTPVIILRHSPRPYNFQVFHAGTALNAAGEVVANGGRVLNVTALGNDVAEAQQKAYQVGQGQGKRSDAVVISCVRCRTSDFQTASTQLALLIETAGRVLFVTLGHVAEV